MNHTLETRLLDRGMAPRDVKIATEEAGKDIKVLTTITKKTVDLLGEYPVKPGAQDIYDAANLAIQQYAA